MSFIKRNFGCLCIWINIQKVYILIQPNFIIFYNIRNRSRSRIIELNVIKHDEFVNTCSVCVVVLVCKQEWLQRLKDVLDFVWISYDLSYDIFHMKFATALLARYKPKGNHLNNMQPETLKVIWIIDCYIVRK